VSVAACRRALERGEPGVYFVDTLNLGDVASFPARSPAQVLVLVVHHLPSLEPGLAPDDPSLAVESKALPLFDAFLVTSPFTGSILTRRGFAASRVLTVPPAPPAVARRPRAFEMPLGAVVVANLIERKGILELLDALAPRLVPTDRFSLQIVGRSDISPAYADRCRRAVEGSRPLGERVRFAGAVPHARIGDVYERADVLVSAARMETFGMALQEARAFGLPILALDGGHAHAHFTHGEDGLLFSSIEALADGFLQLARDDAEARRLFDRAQSLPPAPGDTWARAAQRLVEQLEPWLSST
jgi:glycosyltransferase involved in cell wall biosynthesis